MNDLARVIVDWFASGTVALVILMGLFILFQLSRFAYWIAVREKQSAKSYEALSKRIKIKES